MSEHELETVSERDFQRHVIAELSELKALMKTLVGNGQSGRVAVLESKVSVLSRWLWMILGIGIAVGFLGLEGVRILAGK